MWGSSKYDRELNVVTRIFHTALTQHGGHDKRERGKNEFSPCDVNITKMTADQVTNYMKGNEINVHMSRFNYFTSSGGGGGANVLGPVCNSPYRPSCCISLWSPHRGWSFYCGCLILCATLCFLGLNF